MKVVGWEQKRGSIKTGQLGTGFLGPGFSPGSRVCLFRKFPRLSVFYSPLFRQQLLCGYRTNIPTMVPRPIVLGLSPR
jgi:hypothetical protein